MPITRFGVAQRIVERFRQRRAAPRRMAEVLLRRHRRLAARRVFNVSVALHVHRHDAATRLHTIERRITRAGAPMPFVLLQHTPPAPSSTAARPVEHVTLQRILARDVRRETITRDRQGAAVPALSSHSVVADPPAADRVRPVEFVLRRAAPPSAKDEGGRPLADARPQVLVGSPIIHASTRAGAAAPAIPLSPGELARLTDDVIGAIDRRFVALRERRGIA